MEQNTSKQRELQELLLNYHQTISNEGLAKVGKGQRCHQLWLLNINRCHRVGDVGLTNIAQGCPLLMYLDVGVCQVHLLLDLNTSQLNNIS
uniref:Uncharacterized protein n=1 Tax=Physcomitrium patens TaxID=3218 RepID=A0A2K1IVD2_PHYPA|nr:hypothetical protein PHYPA_025177 [Physcomitrium patens]